MAGMAVSMGLDKEHELHRRRRGRNLAVMAMLVCFAVLLFAVTIVKMGDNAANPSTKVSWGESLMNWMQSE